MDQAESAFDSDNPTPFAPPEQQQNDEDSDEDEESVKPKVCAAQCPSLRAFIVFMCAWFCIRMDENHSVEFVFNRQRMSVSVRTFTACSFPGTWKKKKDAT